MNWKTVISEIKAGLGITQAQIAKRIGISQIGVSDLETGRTKDPRYATGVALMNLHRKAARKLTAQEPTRG